MTARHETWKIGVIVEREAEVRWVPKDYGRGIRPEIETGGEYRINLGAVPWEEIAEDAGLGTDDWQRQAFVVAARVENGELVLSLAYRPVEQPEPLPEGELVACPGCGGFVRRYVLTGELPCPVCGWALGERA